MKNCTTSMAIVSDLLIALAMVRSGTFLTQRKRPWRNIGRMSSSAITVKESPTSRVRPG